MLSESMIAELEYFFAMLLYGFLTALGYHMLVFFRTVVFHSRPFRDAEDILFCMATGFAFFLVAYQKNEGILRWYAFAGSGIGVYTYLRTLGVLLGNVRKWLLQKTGKPFKIKCSKNKNKGRVSEDENSSPKRTYKKKKEGA